MSARGIIAILIVVLFTVGCVSDEDDDDGGYIKLKCKPVVKVTDIDYSKNVSSVPYEGIHTRFAENYTGEEMSWDLVDSLIHDMRGQAKDLGAEPAVLEKAVRTTYTDPQYRSESGPYRIPCYAEKCVFKGGSSWALAFNRANGGEGSASHFDFFMVALDSYEIMNYQGCNRSG